MSARIVVILLLDALRKFHPRYLWHNPVLLLDDDDREDTATASVGGRRPRRRSAARPAGPPVHED